MLKVGKHTAKLTVPNQAAVDYYKKNFPSVKIVKGKVKGELKDRMEMKYHKKKVGDTYCHKSGVPKVCYRC
jgi:hypothetical protein